MSQKYFMFLITLSLFWLGGCSHQKTNDKIYFSHSSQPLTTQTPDLSIKQPYLSAKIHFNNDSHELDTNARQTLQELGQLILQNPARTIVISGHTDNNADAAYNLNLSSRRAHQVKNFLLHQQVKASQIKIYSYGENLPTETNTTPRGRALNRRSVIDVTLL